MRDKAIQFVRTTVENYRTSIHNRKLRPIDGDYQPAITVFEQEIERLRVWEEILKMVEYSQEHFEETNNSMDVV